MVVPPPVPQAGSSLEGLDHPRNAEEPLNTLQEPMDPLEMEGQWLCLGREVLHLSVCVHRWVCAPSSALTQVSWDRGPEHSSEPSAAFSSLHTAGIQGREGPCLPTWPWRAAVCVVGAESPPGAALRAPGEIFPAALMAPNDGKELIPPHSGQRGLGGLGKCLV